MNIDRITFTKTFQTSLSTWEKCGMEASIDENDDPIVSMIKLKNEVEVAHRQSNPQLYKNGNEAIVNSFSGLQCTNGEIKVIKREYERLEDEISDCKTIEELAALKQGLPVDLMPNYMNKLKELTVKIKA